MDGTAHVKHQLGYEKQHARHFVGNIFTPLEVAGVDGGNHLLGGAISAVEIPRTYGEAFQSDSEELCLQAVAHILILGSKDFVQRVLQ